MYKRLLVPLDGSSNAEQALPHAIALAKLLSAKLVLLRILEPFPPIRSMAPASIRTIKQQAKAWAEEYFEKVTNDLQDEGIPVDWFI